MTSSQVDIELALQQQRRFQEQRAPKVEIPSTPRKARTFRSNLGQLLISAGHWLAPSSIDPDISTVTLAPASQPSPKAS